MKDEQICYAKNIFANNFPLCSVISDVKQWYFVTKVVLTYCEKKNSSDREKLLKFEAEGWEFTKFLRSLEQFIQTVKGQSNFW